MNKLVLKTIINYLPRRELICALHLFNKKKYIDLMISEWDKCKHCDCECPYWDVITRTQYSTWYLKLYFYFKTKLLIFYEKNFIIFTFFIFLQYTWIFCIINIFFLNQISFFSMLLKIFIWSLGCSYHILTLNYDEYPFECEYRFNLLQL